MGFNGKVELKIDIGGAYTAGSAVRAAEKDIDKLGRKANELGAVTVTAQLEQGFLGLKGNLEQGIAKAGVLIAAFEQVAGVVGRLGEAISDAAARADQFDILDRRIAGFREIVAQAQEQTAGFFSEQEIATAAAKLDAFGIEATKTGDVLEQVAKTSLRLGTDSSQALDSLVEGVSKLSAARLDNLGITNEAVVSQEELAAATGRAADEVERAEAVNATLTNALKQLNAQNAVVGELQQTNTSSLKVLERAFDDAWTTIKSGLADAAVGFVDWITGTDREMNQLERTIAKVDAAAADSLKRMRLAAERELGAIQREARATSNALLALARLRRETGEGAEKSDKEKVAAAEKRAADTANAIVAAEAVELQRLVKARQLTQEQADRQLEAKRSAVEARQLKRELRQLEETEAADRRKAKARKDAIADADKLLEKTEEERDLIEATSATDLELRDVRREKAKLQADIAKGVGDEVENKRALIKLLQRENRLKLQGSRPSGGGGGGGRSSAPERERRTAELEDYIRLQEARLRAGGELTASEQRQLVELRASREVAKARAELDEGRIDQAAFAVERAIAEAEAKGRLLQIERRLADEAVRRGEAEQSRREQLRSETLGRSDAEREDLQQRLDRLSEATREGVLSSDEARRSRDEIDLDQRIQRLQEFSDAVREAGAAAAASQDDAAAAFARVLDAFDANIEGFAKGGPSAIAAGAQVLASAFDDERAYWAAKAIAEGAEAAAAFGRYDIFAGAQHLAAATGFALAAGTGRGGSGGSGGGAAARRTPQATTLDAPERSDRGGATIYNFNAPIIDGRRATEQQTGVRIGNLVASTAGTGRGGARY